ncbi:MAG: radical SAM protein [Lachnospiraceae bacterium]|nr:radical SAM protein [Lachnospiraceae bacterium]
MKAISVHLTDQCNNSCIFCVVGSHKEKKESVNKRLLTKFLEENANKGYENVNIHGGEATILDDFEEILSLIQEMNYKEISLQTNARKLANIEYAERLCLKGIKLFVVSIHGKNAMQHDNITQTTGSFDEAVQGIRNVKSLGAKVRTNTVVCKDNMKNLGNITEMLINENIDHINISGIHPVGKAYKNFARVTPKYIDSMRYIFMAVDLCIKKNQVITLEGFPTCMVRDYEDYQIKWDDFHFKLLYHNFLINDYSEFMETKTKERGQVCLSCKDTKCGGVYKEYLEFYGWDEFINANEYNLL